MLTSLFTEVFKHGKAFASIPKTLGSYVFNQLQTRVLQELEALVVGLQRVCRGSAPTKVPPFQALDYPGELDDAVKHKPGAFGACAAILDTADTCGANIVDDPLATNSLLMGKSKLQRLRIPATLPDQPQTSVPVYRLRDVLSPHMHEQAFDYLNIILEHRDRALRQGITAEATGSDRGFQPRYIVIHAGSDRPWAIPLLIALKRVHLWAGNGWARPQ